ncbi:MAG: hypothetical protein H8E12_09185 [Rhodobacteraceae bacterium]|nr:hypothetical protein [Paracoccaceae bacterium]
MQYSEIESIVQKVWFTAAGEVISFMDILDIIKKNDCEIYVGADSNPARLPITVATSIAIIKKREFAKYYYTKSEPWSKSIPKLHERLQHEVMLACCVANKIREVLPNRKITVHADINPDSKTASGKYATQFKNYIVGFGFTAIIKPMSWAASCIADKHA